MPRCSFFLFSSEKRRETGLIDVIRAVIDVIPDVDVIMSDPSWSIFTFSPNSLLLGFYLRKKRAGHAHWPRP